MTQYISRFAPWFVLLVLTACASKSILPAEDVAAGKVIEIVGSARITTPAGTRDLHVGDEVAGRDVIHTGPDSWIRIAFAHNGVTWGLGPDKERRVADSVAWKAPRGTGESLLDEKIGLDRSVAAGRHAEREAADTRATILAPGDMNDKLDEGGSQNKDSVEALTAELSRDLSGGELDEEQEKESGGGRDQGRVRAGATTRGSIPSASGDQVATPDITTQLELQAAEPGTGESSGGAPKADRAADVSDSDHQADPEPKQAIMRAAAKAVAVAEKPIAAPLPVVRFEAEEDAVDSALLTAARTAVVSRLREQPKCQLSAAGVTVRVVLQKDGRLQLGGALPKDAKLSACLQAAFSKLELREVTLANPAMLVMTVEWPNK